MKDKSLENLTLTFFFTAGVGLHDWADIGSLERELEFYRRLARRLKRVNLVTYGGKADLLLARKIPELNVLASKWYPRQELTTLHILLKYCPQILSSDILKTNQIRGSQIPIWIKKFFKKKLIIRCGFLHSFFTKKQTSDKNRIADAVTLERKAFTAADVVIVTSSWQRDIVINEYDLASDKIKVIPNYVITDVFRPKPEVRKKYDLVFVGRGDSQKNLTNLLEALNYLKSKEKFISLLMIGECSNNKKIREMAQEKCLEVTFRDNIPNFELPDILNQARVFILPSHYEGHPKALIEAMSCALPCIGTNVMG
ncbi:unnamed protein product, partial [marine sediment metagenome]